MSWINTISYRDATGRLRKLYDRIKGPNDNVDNIMLAHSLRPHTMEGHMAIYKAVLHHSRNKVPKWFLETVGIYVSLLNRCRYCVDHHSTGLSRLLKDDQRTAELLVALERDDLGRVFDAKESAMLAYVRQLTLDPAGMSEALIQNLRELGWRDGEILEINQATAYFSYANRTVLGLGVTTEGDVLGLSPGDSDDPTNWQHG